MPVGIDPGDPRGWGISPIEAEDGTGRAPRISFDEFIRQARCEGSPDLADGLSLLPPGVVSSIPFEQAALEVDLSRWDVAILRETSQHLTRRQIREAYGFTRAEWETVVAPPEPDWRAAFERNEQVIESARSEFPYDPLGYGRVYPAGPSRWTPPDDPDEKIRSCP